MQLFTSNFYMFFRRKIGEPGEPWFFFQDFRLKVFMPGLLDKEPSAGARTAYPLLPGFVEAVYRWCPFSQSIHLFSLWRDASSKSKTRLECQRWFDLLV